MVLHMSTGKWLCSATYALLNAALRTHRFSYMYEIWHTCVSCQDEQKSQWDHWRKPNRKSAIWKWRWHFGSNFAISMPRTFANSSLEFHRTSFIFGQCQLHTWAMLNCGAFEFSGYGEAVAPRRISMTRHENLIASRSVIHCPTLTKVDTYDKAPPLNIFQLPYLTSGTAPPSGNRKCHVLHFGVQYCNGWHLQPQISPGKP